MCGIAGIWTKSVISGAEMVEKCLAMSNLLSHRGPDDEGFVLVNVKGELEHFKGSNSVADLQIPSINEASGNYVFGLVHRRLSIISPGIGGHQPMQNGPQVLAYNGEIFNYKQLDSKNNFINRSNTDTETLLQLLAKYGKNTPTYVDGFFAYALYNSESNKLELAVDPTSVKHIFYGNKGDCFCFASESKVVRKILGLTEVNAKAVFHFLTEEMLLVPNADGSLESYISGVQKMKPGNILTINNQFEISTNTYEYITTIQRQPLEEKIVHGIESRLMADVPLGFAASGGLDSAIVVGAARKILGPNATMKLFSVVSQGHKEDESKWQKEVAKFNHAEWITCDTANFKADILESVVEQVDMPAVAWNNLAHFALCKTVKENNVTVLFNGQGADELFGGYTEYLQRDFLKNIAFLYRYRKNWPMPLSEIFKGYIKFKTMAIIPNALLQKKFIAKQNGWIGGDLLEYNSYAWSLASLDAKSKMTDDYFGQKLGQMLLWEDVNGMAHHLESRNPFADNVQLFEHMRNTSYTNNIRGGFTKYNLRLAAKNLVPNNLLWRKDKQGFSVPDDQLTLKFASAWKEMFLHENLDNYIPKATRETALKNISHANKTTLRRYFKAVSLATYLNSI